MSRLKVAPFIESGPRRVSAYRSYVLALALTAIALVIRLPLLETLAGIQPFATFYFSVALSAWWWGTRPAIVAALAGLVAGTFFFLEPRLTFEAESLLPTVVYLFFSTICIALVRQTRKSESASQIHVRRVQATETELQQRRALLDGLAASVLDGILIVSPEGKIIYANDQFQQIWRFPPEVLASHSDVVALNWAETQVADPRAFREGVARAYSARETPIREELHMKDGRVFDRYGAPVINEGVHYGWVWTFRDVTERKQAEIQLREGEEHLRRVLDGLFTFVGVLTPDGTLIEANRAPLEAAGLKSADVLGKKFWETYWWSYSTDAQETLRTAVERASQGHASRYDVVVRMAGDSRRWIDFQISPLRDSHGRITSLIPSAMDITERKQVEQALRESERHFHQAFADAPIGMVLTDLNGRFLHVNRAYCELTGYREAELTQSDMDYRQITSPSDLERNLGSFRKLVAGEIPAFFVEKRYIRKDGTLVWVRASASLRRDAEGRPFQIIGLAENISDRKETQEALLESEQRHRQLAKVLEAERAKLGAVIENIPIGIGIGDTSGTTLSLNKAGLHVHGFKSEADMLSKMDQYISGFELSYLDGRLMPPAEWPAQRAIRGDYVKDYELRLRNRLLGLDRVVSYNVAPVRNSEGETSVIVYVMQDLTEQKLAQEALRVSEGMMDAFLNASPGILNLFDQQLRYIRTDTITPTYFGLSQAGIIGQSVADLNPVFAAEFLQPMLRHVTETGEAMLNREIPGPVPSRGGEIGYWQVSYFPVPLPGGERGLGVIGTDVTDKKRAEDLLRQSEELFRAVAENIPQLAWMTGPDGEILWFNRRWTDYTGTTLKDMQQNGWKSVHHPDHPERVAAGWIQALQTGEPWEDTFPLRRRDGEYRWFLSRAFPIRDSQGTITRWFGTNTDVTEHKQAEEALRESEEHLRTLFTREADTRQTLVLAMEAGHIGTFAWNVVENRHVWSKETEQFFGYAPGEFPGTTESFLDRVHPQDRDWLRQTLYSRFERQETAFSSQYRAQHPDGSVTWLSVRGRVDYRSPGVPLRVIGVMVDITAMKKSEEALANARNQLVSHAANLEAMVAERTAKLTETVHELEAFSYSLSHDMRAPLRAMKGFAQILESEYTSQLPPEACGYLKKISRAAGRLDQLIQDVLTYSHILRGHIDLKPIDIDKLARQLIEENPALQPPKAEITIMSPCHAVYGHEAYLMQVLSNLVYNAVKFVQPDQLPKVRIWTEVVGSEVHLFVKDNGIGIPKAAHERMFGMFQRYHSDKMYEGTGIGLTIVRKATERMGGQVSLESEPGEGSTFRVQLRKA